MEDFETRFFELVNKIKNNRRELEQSCDELQKLLDERIAEVLSDSQHKKK